MHCTLCPRDCHADRDNGKTGYCGESAALRVSRAALHYWEEPCISGKSGSGTIFFTGCPLKCIFCQNESIANGSIGKSISVDRLSEIFLELQDKGACNINLVTPTHFIPQIANALEKSKDHGLQIPIVYNTGGYEKAETLKFLSGLVDIYLPDLKYYSTKLSSKYSNAPDYFQFASEAIAEMYRQVGTPIMDHDTELMRRGIIVRHLLLPRHLADSKKIISYLHDTYRDNIYLSIMSQYTPMRFFPNMPELSRRVTRTEYRMLLDYCIQIGIENAFIQEGDTASESFIPPFDCEGI